jgi:hypothetical protein
MLGSFDAVQPAGTYVIDVEEEAIEGVSFPAFRRLSTQMQISTLGKTEHRFINPVELDEALLRDAAQEELQSGPTSSMPEGMQREKAKRVKAWLARRH